MSKPFVQNAANEKQVKNAELKERDLRRQELEDMRFILSTPQGRRFIWRYLTRCGVFALSYSHSGSETAFNEGQRNIGLKLMAELSEADASAYVTILKENKGDQAE
jgi:hypothetical protein